MSMFELYSLNENANKWRKQQGMDKDDNQQQQQQPIGENVFEAVMEDLDQ